MLQTQQIASQNKTTHPLLMNLQNQNSPMFNQQKLQQLLAKQYMDQMKMDQGN